MSETKISREINDMIKKRFYDDIAIDRHQCGMLLVNRRYIHCGTPGWADRIGIILRGKNAGKFIGIEVKKPGGKQEPEQIKFQTMIELAGGFYLLVESVEQAIQRLEVML